MVIGSPIVDPRQNKEIKHLVDVKNAFEIIFKRLIENVHKPQDMLGSEITELIDNSKELAERFVAEVDRCNDEISQYVSELIK